MNCQRTGAVGLNILDRRIEPRNAKSIWPVAWTLLGKQLVAARDRQIVKCRRRFCLKKRCHRAVGQIGKFDWNQLHAHLPQLVQRRLVEARIGFALFLLVHSSRIACLALGLFFEGLVRRRPRKL